MNNDIYRFLESLKFRPETYSTMLGNKCDTRKSETTVIRRKISGFVRKGLIGAGNLDGGMGLKIFFSLEKNYFVFIVRKDLVNYFYYCSTVDDFTNEIILYNSFILDGCEWKYLGNITILKEHIKRWF